MREGFHFVNSEMSTSKLRSDNLAQTGSDVVWVGETALVLGVDCRLKTTSHRSRLDPCWYVLWGCCGVNDDISAAFQAEAENTRE